MKQLTCICCPRGCLLSVDEENGFAVSGNSCERGAEYGFTECTAPTRTLTSSVPVSGGDHARCAVKTDKPIPKEKLFEAMAAVRTVRASAPIRTGDVLLADVCGTGANLIAGRDVAAIGAASVAARDAGASAPAGESSR